MEIIGVILYIIVIAFSVYNRLQRDSLLRRNNSYTYAAMNEAATNTYYQFEAERLKALREAKIYLSPYKDIWANLRLSNKLCSLLLGRDGQSITGFEKVAPYRSFTITDSPTYDRVELWNMFCKYYSFNTSYDELKELCYKFNVSIKETVSGKTKENSRNDNTLTKEIKTENPKPVINQVDINNCSELELTELPGISIVLAKKIVNKRNEINGFKNIDEFFSFMKLKPHMESQLRNYIKIEKMKVAKRKKLNSERSIDL